MVHPSPAVHGVLFDLDDTLIDWWGSLESCLRDIAPDEVADTLLAHTATTFWEPHPEHGHIWHRNTWALHHHRHLEWRVALADMEPAEVGALLRRFEESLWVGFFADTVPTIEQLLATFGEKVRFGVLSNNGMLAAEADRLDLHRWFDVLVSADQAAPKPEPSAFLASCTALGTDPARTVYVGDSVRTDVLGALGAGLVPVWIDRYGDPWPGMPAGIHRIGALAELPELLAGLT